MEPIKVGYKNFHKAITAFETLYGREPKIRTCSRFEDDTDCSVFGSVPVVKVGKTKFTFACDETRYTAYIKAVEFFWFS